MVGVYSAVERTALEVAEYERISGCIADRLVHVDSSHRIACDMLVREIAFLAVTLRELREIISRDGPLGVSVKDAQKPSAVVMTYDRLANTYAKYAAQLEKAIPIDNSILPLV
jgi:hypothetical protein